MAQQTLSLSQFDLSSIKDYFQEAAIAEGTPDALTVTLTISIPDGMACSLRVKVPGSNTTVDPTLRLNGWALPRTIIKGDGAALVPGDLVGWHDFRFDPNIDAFIVLNPFTRSTNSSALTYLKDKRDSLALNTSVPVHAVTCVGPETSLDLAIVAKGAGSILAQIIDGTPAGGNKRGRYATDFQRPRTVADQVASGDFSVLCGGSSNSTLSDYTSCLGGANNIVDGMYSTVSGGSSATTRNLIARSSFASGKISTIGDTQIGRQVLFGTTNDNTPTVLTAGGGYPNVSSSGSNVSILPDNFAYTVVAYVTARNTTTGDMASWKVEGSVKRGAGANTITLVGTPVVIQTAFDASAASWTVNLVVDTNIGAVEILAIGDVGTPIHWTCQLDTIEIS